MSLSVSTTGVLLTAALALSLGGCASTTPSTVSDPAADRPAGVLDSLQAYQPAAAKKTRKQAKSGPAKARAQAPKTAALAQTSAPTPRREPARIMRLWIAPWEDANGNLHGASFVYTEVQPQRWQLDDPATRNATLVLRPLQIEPRAVTSGRQ
ncbi:TraV family lipoprotein [Thiohalocapsa marina]|uniref:TraV family lipoprotein n=1 Tax=Thiohalocapsa marina TaxID=424902 RepID=A0A5M8FVS1_9GAMM|nr:TraV family lipoprotein [Thiohalocapsa marina]KAA6187922.1 TraV family lipoprotein [Thiohalocapsa marina]